VKTQAIALIGRKKVGKTTTGEKLTAELVRRGFKVAALKHISEPDFSIDSPGKDTWRYAEAGARTIIAVSPREIVTIEKNGTSKIGLDSLLKKCSGHDIVFIEGLKDAVAKNNDIPKIAVTATREQAEIALHLYKPILAFTGPYNTESLNVNVPYVDAMKNPDRLADIIEKTLSKK
jgi:molybdopterin-guanine dinucleotide biosynthesis adapter protein